MIYQLMTVRILMYLAEITSDLMGIFWDRQIRINLINCGYCVFSWIIYSVPSDSTQPISLIKNANHLFSIKSDTFMSEV